MQQRFSNSLNFIIRYRDIFFIYLRGFDTNLIQTITMEKKHENSSNIYLLKVLNCTIVATGYIRNIRPQYRSHMMDKLMNGFADVLKMCITLNFSLMSFFINRLLAHIARKTIIRVFCGLTFHI